VVVVEVVVLVPREVREIPAQRVHLEIQDLEEDLGNQEILEVKVLLIPELPVRQRLLQHLSQLKLLPAQHTQSPLLLVDLLLSVGQLNNKY
jgi:hypothetical protein